MTNQYYEEWCEEARRKELALCLQKFNNGSDVNSVLELLTHRLCAKLQWPLYDMVKKEIVKDYDPDASLEWYKENYIKRFNRVSDHIIDK